MKYQSLKNIFIFGLTLLSFGFLSAQFVIPSVINNALQIIQSVLVTNSGTSTGSVIMHTNTGNNNIYINPSYLPIAPAYSGQYVLTVNASGYVSLTTGVSSISGATISGGNLLLNLTNGSTINAGSVVGPQGPAGPQGPQGIQGVPGANGATGVGITSIVPTPPNAFTITLSNGSEYTFSIPGGSGGTDSQTLSIIGNSLAISNGNTVNLGSLGFWSLVGNAGTNPLTNFIGTTDSQDLVFKTNNSERMRILGNSGYVGIGTNNPVYPLTVSGGVFSRENETAFYVGNDGGNAGGYPIPGVFMAIDGTMSSGSMVKLALYDTRPFGGGNEGLGINMSTQSNIGVNGLESEASLNTKNGKNMDLRVEQGIDFSNFNKNIGSGTVTSDNQAKIDMNADIISLSVGTGLVHNVVGGSVVSTDYQYKSRIDIDSTHIHMYGSGGLGFMVFDSIFGRFGFSTWNPGNIIEIANSVNNTLGLRLSAMGGGYTNWVLGLDANQDVIPLAHISTLQGGGGPISNYLKLGELDYTQLNSHTGVDILIPLLNANQLPANSLVKRLFVQVSSGFFVSMSANSVQEFALYATGGSVLFINPSDGFISAIGYPFPFGAAYTFSLVPATGPNPIPTEYYIFVRYTNNVTSNDRVQGHASFVVEYETMPSIPF